MFCKNKQHTDKPLEFFRTESTVTKTVQRMVTAFIHNFLMWHRPT